METAMEHKNPTSRRVGFTFLYLPIMASLIFSVLLAACSPTQRESMKDATMKSSILDGTWVPIKQELGGKLLPKAIYAKQKLILSDSTYTFTAESIDKGVVWHRDDKMDIYGKEGVNAGKHFTAIYRYDNEQLSICYNLLGDSYPESFETKSKPTLFLSVFTKEMAK
jgi:uncharacterized protein (TIGR03067 family)